MDGGGDLGFSQEVGNLSESCISQKKRLEVKLETAVNSISEKNSRACFFFPFGVAKVTQPPLRGERKRECRQIQVAQRQEELQHV